MTYNIPEGNWTSAVKLNIGSNIGSFLYPIGYSSGSPNPAPNCLKKTFYAKYKCGNEINERSISTIIDAVGKQAKFDCTSLFNICNGSTLHLGDDGILTIKDDNQNKLWDSTEDPMNATRLSPNVTLALDAYKPILSDGTLNTNALMPYKRSYLKSGEFLQVGQFIGSPSGNCQLIMNKITPTAAEQAAAIAAQAAAQTAAQAAAQTAAQTAAQAATQAAAAEAAARTAAQTAATPAAAAAAAAAARPASTPALANSDAPVVGTLYGWAINNNSSIPVLKAKYLNDGTTIVYIAYDNGYTKMVTNTGVTKYYEGPVDNFNASQWTSYRDGGGNGGYLYNSTPTAAQAVVIAASQAEAQTAAQAVARTAAQAATQAATRAAAARTAAQAAVIQPSTNTPGTTFSLQVVYNAPGCTDRDPIDSNSSKLYTIPWTNRDKLGNMGFVNEYGQLQTYNNTITTSGYSSTFTKLANADGSTYGMYGGNLDNGLFQNVENAEKCKEKCETYDLSGGVAPIAGALKCVGFEYEKIGKTCQLKGEGVITQGIRRYNIPITGTNNPPNYEYYSRLKTVSGLDTSCTSSVISGSTTDWVGFTLGDPMTSSKKCGLTNAVSSQRDAVAIADASLNSMTGLFTNTINNLYRKYEDLKRSLSDNKTKLSTKFDELNASKKDLADWSSEQSEQLDAMSEDRDLNMMSQNYKHIMWSILAILVIIGIIKFTKSFGGIQSLDIAKSVNIPNIPAAATVAT